MARWMLIWEQPTQRVLDICCYDCRSNLHQSVWISLLWIQTGKKNWTQIGKRGFWLVMTKTAHHTWSPTQTLGESSNADHWSSLQKVQRSPTSNSNRSGNPQWWFSWEEILILHAKSQDKWSKCDRDIGVSSWNLMINDNQAGNSQGTHSPNREGKFPQSFID